MDPREVIILSSDDEMSIDPHRTPSNESNGRSRAFSGPVEMSLDSDDLLGGMDLSLRVFSILLSVRYDYQKWNSTFVSQATRGMPSMRTKAL